FDTWHSHAANDVQAFFRVGVVTNHIAQACVMGTALLFRVLEYHVQSFQIRVDIGNDCVLHRMTLNTSTNNGKSSKLVLGLAPGNIFVSDQEAETAVANRLLKSFQFFSAPFADQF